MTDRGRRLWTMGTAGLFLGVMALFASRLELDGDITHLLPDRTLDLRQKSAVLRRLMERTVIDLCVAESAENSSEVLTEAADRLRQALEGSGEVSGVLTGLPDSAVVATVEYLREHTARLLPADQLTRVEEQIRPVKLRRTLETLARRLQEPDGAHLALRAARDPVGISDRVLEPLATLTAGLEEARLERGYIVSDDGRHLLLFVLAGFPSTDVTRSARFVTTVERAAADVLSEPRFAGLEVRYLGAHRSALDNARQIRRDILVTVGVGTLFLVTVVLVTFSRPLLSLLALTPALAGAVTALGVCALMMGRIVAAVAGFGAVLLGITVDYAVHVFFRLEGTRGRLPTRALLMGATTTAAAFLALLGSSLRGVRTVGFFGAVGVLTAALFSLWVLPCVVARKQARRRPLVDLRLLLDRARGVPLARHVPLAAVALTPFVAAGALRLESSGEVSKLSSLSPPVRQDEEAILRTWGDAFRATTVVVAGPTREEALRKNELLARSLAEWRAEGVIREYASLAGLVPARATQTDRLQAWRKFWSEERIARLRRDLAAATEGTPFRADAFERFFAWLEMDPDPIGDDLLSDSGLTMVLGDRLFETEESVVVTTHVFTEDWAQVARLEECLARELPSAVLLNRETFAHSVAAQVVSEMWILGGIAFAAVVLAVFAWCRQARTTLVVLLPLLVSFAWSLGLLGWLGVRITLANAVFTAFLFGLAVDYAIFMAQSRVEKAMNGEDHTLSTDAAVLLCAVTTAIGFGALMLAGHPVLYSIGVTVLVGIVCAGLATHIFVPLLARLLLEGQTSPEHRRQAGKVST